MPRAIRTFYGVASIFHWRSSKMNDPLSEVITLLQPRAVFSRRYSGAGRWGVRYSAFGKPSFRAVLEGSCRLAVDGRNRAAEPGRRALRNCIGCKRK